MLLGNLFRDQLDRYGELETIADRWAATVAGLPAAARAGLNADDPLIADLGRHHPGVRYFGVEDPADGHRRRCSTPRTPSTAAAAAPPTSTTPIYLGHLGVYHCPRAASAGPSRPSPPSDIRLHGTRSAAFVLPCPAGAAEIELPLPGLYNVYNALGAATLCLALGVSLETIAAGLAAVSPAFGRAERVAIGATELSILLIKNPAGANEILRTLALEPDELDLLAILNDRTADGRDISWIWDADFELLAGRARHVTCAGTRAAELALRLKYAGLAAERLTVVPALGRALDAALRGAPTAGCSRCPPTRRCWSCAKSSQRRGHVAAFWSTRDRGAGR